MAPSLLPVGWSLVKKNLSQVIIEKEAIHQCCLVAGDSLGFGVRQPQAGTLGSE